MTPDGEFVDVRQPGGPPPFAAPFPVKVIGVGMLVAVVAGAVGIALLALWLALTLIPIAIGGALIAYGVFRVQLWRARHRSLSGQRDLFRP